MLHKNLFNYNAHAILCSMIVGVVTIGILSACTGRIATRGNLSDPERLAEAQPKEISKGGVLELLGSPSTTGSYENSDTWIYHFQKTETFAFFAPKIIDRKTVIIKFDAKGVVSKVRTLGKDDSKKISPISRTTPSSGEELTIIDQIKSNIDRFMPTVD